MGGYMASVSFGKDSIAMVYAIVEGGLPLDEAVFFDTGMEFEAVYAERDRMLPYFADARASRALPGDRGGVPLRLRLVRRPVPMGHLREGANARRPLQGRIGRLRRHRRRRDPAHRPRDCLALCYERGHTWSEAGVRLYDVLDRVSCWCCRTKNHREIRAMREHLPEYYGRLEELEAAIGTMKRRPLSEI